MSHFTKIKTQLVKKDCIVNALKDLGHQVTEGRVNIRGWNGQQTEVEIKVPTRNAGYDLGFRKEGQTYDLVADWYGIEDIQAEPFLAQVQQRYAYHVVVGRMTEQGFEIAQEEQEADNTIHLTVRRMVF
jgi:hypothetical protein